MNTRTKETFWYKHIGATEEAAQQSAMGKVQEKGYVATFPVTYNINGVPTYVMSLKDQAGLIKMIAMVSVEDYTIVGVGNTAQECLRSYKSILNSNSNDIEVTSQQTHNTINGKVSRFASDTRDGNTYYYLKLDNFDKTFIGTSLSSTSIILTHESDSVSVSYDNANTQLIDIVRFQNLTLGDK
ncbi:hypothetical protein LVD15_01955 [Fulvivirga maritima]|uniref:hypothetical protein n=1 Tax=Fulvivirga maritima TaxID=2904247 RepID=UPI001F2607F3|nr:hypothetical protein [Fulvivirga maritima]UII27214.1 hypothetical protein LVD15_01955 [Fulvivirga maritima]